MEEHDIFISNLEKLRHHFNLTRGIINESLGWGEHKYSRIHSEEQDATLKEVIQIAAVYGLKAEDLLKIDLEMPAEKSIHKLLRKYRVESKVRPERGYEKKGVFNYITIILNSKFKVNDTFTNSQIKALLPPEIGEYYKKRSIGWKRGILKDCVVKTKMTHKGATKLEVLFQLVADIPDEIVKRAQEAIDKEMPDWVI